MSNYVTISVIGYWPPPGDPNEDSQKVVDRAIKHWQGEFAKVLPDRPDLIVLPENCDRPAACPEEKRADFFRIRGDQVQESFARTAKANHCYITYPSLRRLPDGTWRNSTVVLDRSGTVAGIYNKNHVCIQENTEEKCLYGKSASLIECDFGKVGCAICFDLNFDELRQQYVQLKPDLLLFCSSYHGGLMQNYWAYSCRCHFAAAVWHPNPSRIIAPTGEVIASTTNYFSHVTARINLDCRLAHLDENWVRLDALRKKHGTKVRVHDPGQLGAVLISSEADGMAVQDMIREFEIELLDDYFQRCRTHRREPGRVEAW